jgi:nitrogen fixation protein FixH
MKAKLKKIINPGWGTRITIVYSTFAIGTLAWAGYAMSRDVDLVRPDYYEYSLQHDVTARASESAEALGSGASITVDAEAVIVKVPTTAAISEGSVSLYRPNSVALDRTYPMHIDPNGVMRIPYKMLPPGQWQVTAEWVAGGTPYKLSRRAMF